LAQPTTIVAAIKTPDGFSSMPVVDLAANQTSPVPMPK
jgi:hypothetical protein